MIKRDTISIAIPCHDNSDNLFIILESIRMQTRAPDEIIIINDNSSANETNNLKRLSKISNCRYHKLPDHPNGIAFQGRRSMARNAATRISRGDIILYLDGDMLLAPSYIDEIISYHKHDQFIFVKGQRCSISQEEQSKGIHNCLSIAASGKVLTDITPIKYHQQLKDVGNSLRPLYGAAVIGAFTNCSMPFSRRIFLSAGLLMGIMHFIPKNVLSNIPYSLNWQACISNNLSVRRKHVEKIGFWDENFIGWGEEDIDFAYRLTTCGLRPVTPISTGAKAYHLEHTINYEENKITLLNNARYMLAKHPHLYTLRNPVYRSYGIEIDSDSLRRLDVHKQNRDFS